MTEEYVKKQERPESPSQVCPEIDSAAAAKTLLLLSGSGGGGHVGKTSATHAPATKLHIIAPATARKRSVDDLNETDATTLLRNPSQDRRPSSDQLNQRHSSVYHLSGNGSVLNGGASPIIRGIVQQQQDKPKTPIVVYSSQDLNALHAASVGVYGTVVGANVRHPCSDSDSFTIVNSKPAILKRENNSRMAAGRKIPRKESLNNGGGSVDDTPSPLPTPTNDHPSVKMEYHVTSHADHDQYGASVSSRAQSAPLDMLSPGSSDDDDEDDDGSFSTTSRHNGSSSLRDYYSGASSPDSSKPWLLDGKHHNGSSRTYVRKRQFEKNAPDYRVKRDKNNEAVKKSRAKSKAYQESLKSKFDELSDENRELKRRLELAERRAEVAERQKEYLQGVLQTLAGRKEKIIA